MTYTLRDWQKIHRDFTIELKEDWEDFGFNYQEAKKLIEENDLTPDSVFFAYQLKNNLLLKYKLDHSLQYEELEKVSALFKKGLFAQEWLDKNYPEEKRSEFNKLNIISKNLKKELVIENWINLKEIKCVDNQLDSLILLNLPNLTKIYCGLNNLKVLSINNCSKINYLDARENYLSNLNFLDSLNPKEITYLKIPGNNFSSQNLSIFSKFINLEQLDLGLNNFYGSLKSLKNLTKLKWLGIHGTDIDGGLEYLSDSVEEMVIRKGEKKEISKELEVYRKNDIDIVSYHNPQNWRKDQLGYQLLKGIILKVNPDLNVQDIIDQFEFFNVKTGSFHGNFNNLLFLFNLNQEEAYFLRKTIETLTKEIKKYKQKIVEAYSYFCSEKELLQELITAHLEYSKSKQQNLSTTYKLRKKCDNIKSKLENNFLVEEELEEFMNKVEIILNDCDELVRNELEIENKVNCNKLIEEIKNEFTNLNITVSQGNVIIGSGFGNNTNLSFTNNDELIKAPKRPKRDSWENSPTARNKIEELELTKIEEREQIALQEIPPK